MKHLKAFAQQLWKDESGQGMAEYVLLIVVIIAVAAVFKDPIIKMVQGKMQVVSEKFGSFGNSDMGN
ncbi:MAG: hypothetical protein C5B49_14410 [Bdellovibrio sp.]|nr:MAG: hypothetical protein C5B49_14410 [Bdellovibrio sp.]